MFFELVVSCPYCGWVWVVSGLMRELYRWSENQSLTRICWSHTRFNPISEKKSGFPFILTNADTLCTNINAAEWYGWLGAPTLPLGNTRLRSYEQVRATRGWHWWWYTDGYTKLAPESTRSLHPWNFTWILWVLDTKNWGFGKRYFLCPC